MPRPPVPPNGRPPQAVATSTPTSRRALLRLGLGLGAMTALGGAGGHVLAANLLRAPAAIRPAIDAQFPLCRTAADGTTPTGPLRPLKLAWTASGICTAAAPVAKETGIFARHGLDVDFVNFGASTEMLLEALATGKADAGLGMALRWLKPLEQGFDVKITAGLHGGCMRLLGAPQAGVSDLQSLRGKTIAIADQAGPAKNFFSIYLAERGIDPFKEVEWRQYPGEALTLAVDKGEAQAIAHWDPLTWLFLKERQAGGESARFVEIASNLSEKYATRSCCIIGVNGSLIRNDKPVATALTRAILEGGHVVHQDPRRAAEIFSAYGGKGSVDELAEMLRSHTHNHAPVGPALKQEIALYAEELKVVQVFRPTTNTQRFAEKVYADVLS